MPASSGRRPPTAVPDSEYPRRQPPKGKLIDMQPDTERTDTPNAVAPEDQPGEPEAEGGSQSDAKDKLPAVPADDDSALGDTDQHSDA
jgi:hypothetical protein